MNLDRRSFIRSSLVAGTGLLVNPVKAIAGKNEANLFGVHPFVQDNPDAVFIMRTNVDVKTNGSAMKEAGRAFADSVLGLTDDAEKGVPLSHNFVFKPNLTCRSKGHSKYTVERSMGIVTDSNFMEGIIESMNDLTIPASQMYIREVNCASNFEDSGYVAMAQRTGIDLADLETPYYELQPEQIQWMDVPEGVYFNRIPYLWPVNSPDSWLMNVSKLKAHGMGITTCAKNLQGTIALNYQEHCRQYGTHLDIKSSDYRNDAFDNIIQNYNRRVAEGVPRWDKPGNYGGLWQETWASRCLDNNSVSKAGLHVIEGIYSRDGNFMNGPSEDGIATDYMSNYIIFGMNAFYVDIIGHWLAGHEPGNFGLFHMAMDRGMITHLNPSNIPLYTWNNDSDATLVNLKDFERTPLKTYYLQKDYDGGTEAYWHMVDETYNYDDVGIQTFNTANLAFHLGNNYPNPVKWKTTIPYRINKPGQVYIEVINAHDMIIEVLENRYMEAGSHMVKWQSMNHPPGLYLYRMCFNGGSQTGRILVYH